MTESNWGGRRPNTGPKRRRIHLDAATAKALAEVLEGWRKNGFHAEATPDDVVKALILQARWGQDVRKELEE